MSVYFTPSGEFVDGEASYSEDSVYITPEISSTDSVFDMIFVLPRVEKTQDESCDNFEWNSNELPFCSPLSESKTYREKDAIFDKENVHCSLSPRYLGHFGGDDTLVKSLTNIATLQPSCVGLDGIGPNYNSQIDKFDECKKVGVKSRHYNLLGRMGFHQRSKTNFKVLRKNREKKSSDMCLDADGESIIIRFPSQSYGSLRQGITGERKGTKTHCDPQTRQVVSRGSSFSILKKFRLSPLKRLFTRSISNIRSCYTKCSHKFSKSNYHSLDVSNGNITRSSVDDVKKADVDGVPESNALKNNCQIKYSPTTNVEELMRSVILKLSSIENELKELKKWTKEYSSRGSVSYAPPPVPPPLPPPAPPLPLGNVINHSSTPKRKVDLTTPENDQLAKRPSRVQEQRAQFSVTVEDLRKVKLRKVGNSTTKKVNIDKNYNREHISLSASACTLRYKRNRTVNKELSEIAAEILSPRKSVTASDSNFISSLCTATNTTTNSSLYEQTPKRTKRASSILRSVKRKELLGDSPVRKRLNSSGLSSPQSRNSVSDVTDTVE